MSAALAQLLQSLRRDLRPDRAWLVVLAAVTLLEFLWWSACWLAGIAPAPSFGPYVAGSLAALAAAAGLRTALLPQTSRAGWVSIIAATMLVALAGSLFLPLKYAIPAEVPFWLDTPLAHAERALFGADPWRLMDALFGWAIKPVDLVYGLWLPVQLVVLFSVVVSPPSPARSRALIAYSLAWFLLGVFAATLLSSAGPVFHDRLLGGDQFAGLAQRLRSGGAWMVQAESDAMWRSFAGRRPGLVAGISAMPSLHIAISAWMWLSARTLVPKAAPFALAYALFMWAASVQLGWHYATDGLAGILGMTAVWKLAERVRTSRPLHALDVD